MKKIPPLSVSDSLKQITSALDGISFKLFTGSRALSLCFFVSRNYRRPPQNSPATSGEVPEVLKGMRVLYSIEARAGTGQHIHQYQRSLYI